MSLIDGTHKILRCSMCNAALVDVWCTNPFEDIEWSLQAFCSCGDKSFVEKIKGGFHHAEGADAVLVDVQMKDGLVKFTTLLKGK